MNQMIIFVIQQLTSKNVRKIKELYLGESECGKGHEGGG